MPVFNLPQCAGEDCKWDRFAAAMHEARTAYAVEVEPQAQKDSYVAPAKPAEPKSAAPAKCGLIWSLLGKCRNEAKGHSSTATPATATVAQSKVVKDYNEVVGPRAGRNSR